MLINTDYLREEIVLEDVDTTDADEIEYAVDTLHQCAAGAVAEVDIVVLSAEDGIVTVEVSGHYAEMGPFLRRWND